jgi:hypothetical protein
MLTKEEREVLAREADELLMDGFESERDGRV